MLQQVFAGRYELLEHIGGGGMADVYRANDRLLERPVAVKILHEQFSNDEEFVAKFHREAQGAARLSHPNIVNIYDVGQQEKNHYIIMEYVPGMTLKDKIKEEGHLSVHEALRIAEQIASALVHAHKNNLVHCDIKPHNILVMPDGDIKVADFGIARAVSSSTMTYGGNVVGSVHYFSPEQAKGSMITPKTDVYSLGVVLYEMLTGCLPFNGETSMGIALKHLQENPPSLREINPSIPPVVEAMVLRAMTKASAERPDSRAFLQELKQTRRMLSQDERPAVSADPFATQVMQPIRTEQLYDMQSESSEEQEETPVLKSKKFIIGLAAVLFLGFFVGAFLSYGKFWSTAEVIVPDVVGKQMNVAQQILEDKNLRVKVAETYDADVPVGQVVSQYPEAGITVKEERQVTIYISKGGEEIEMPELKGMTKSEAQAKLERIGLKLDAVKEVYSDEPAGTVLSQDPRAGTKINKGKSVDITVSQGKEKKTVTVPELVGGTLSQATSSITSKNLKVGNITRQVSKQAKDTVISQSPAGGSEVTEGSAVSFVIAVPDNENSNGKQTPKQEERVEPSMKNQNGKSAE